IDAVARLERPAVAPRRGEDDAAVSGQVGRRSRRAEALEVGRTGAYDALAVGDLARHQGRIAQRAGPYGDVDAFGQDVHHLVGEGELARTSRWRAWKSTKAGDR